MLTSEMLSALVGLEVIVLTRPRCVRFITVVSLVQSR